jgi:hypothetical protein
MMSEIQQAEAALQFNSFFKDLLTQMQGDKKYMVHFIKVGHKSYFGVQKMYSGVQFYRCSNHVVICRDEQFMVLTEKDNPVPFRAGYHGMDNMYSWRDYALFDQWLQIDNGSIIPVQGHNTEPIILPLEEGGGVYFGKLVFSYSLNEGTLYDTEDYVVVVKEEDQKYMVLPKDKENPKPFWNDEHKMFGVWISCKDMRWIKEGALVMSFNV